MSGFKNYDFGQASPAVSAQASNRVLRNTYFLLALSLIPTAVGAWVGIAFGFFQLFGGSPIISLLVMLGVMFGFIWGIQRNRDRMLGVYLMLGFTFFMGLML